MVVALNTVLELGTVAEVKAERALQARLAEAALDKERGSELFRARHYARAADSFGLALDKDPGNATYLMNRCPPRHTSGHGHDHLKRHAVRLRNRQHAGGAVAVGATPIRQQRPLLSARPPSEQGGLAHFPSCLAGR